MAKQFQEETVEATTIQPKKKKKTGTPPHTKKRKRTGKTRGHYTHDRSYVPTITLFKLGLDHLLPQHSFRFNKWLSNESAK